MTLFIPRKVVGFDKDIIVDDDEIVLSSDIEMSSDMWHLSDKAYRSILRIGAATAKPLEMLPKDPRIAWWSEYSSDLRYDYILGKKRFNDNAKRIIAECKSTLQCPEYFLTQYQVQNHLLDMLKPAHASSTDIFNITDSDLASLHPDDEGRCQTAIYDNYSSSTGRMSIKSGPKILTLDKRFRHVFRSQWGTDGVLVSIDYSALEPRVIMTLMGEKDLPQDIYTSISEKIGISGITREVTKVMILSVLYGMMRKNFILKFIDHTDPDVIYDKLQDVLGVKAMSRKIKSEMTGDFITNYYGRPLRCENENLFVNHYTQSTAVDVACDGFLNLAQDCSAEITPIFLLHDEMIVDVHKDNIEKLKNACKNGLFIPSLNTNFYTTMKVFNARKDH